MMLRRSKETKSRGTLVNFHGVASPTTTTMTGTTLRTDSGAVIAVVNPDQEGGGASIVVIKGDQSVNASLTSDECIALGYYIKEAAKR